MRRLNPLVVIIVILLIMTIIMIWRYGPPQARFAGAQDNDTATPTPQCIIVPWDGAPYRCDTATPQPSAMPSSTPLPYPTPTIEVAPTAMPTNTPTPSPTPDMRCLGTVNAEDGLIVRSVPGGVRIGGLPFGAQIELYSRWDYNGIIWYGHYAIADDEAGHGFLLGYSHGLYLDISGDCSGLVPATPEITRTVVQGAHILMGSGGEVPAQFAQQQTAVKVLDGSWDIGAWMKQANPDIWLLCRSFLWDSIAVDTNYNARLAWDTAKHSIPTYCDAFELENEHAPTTDAQWQQWSAFSIQVAQLAQAERNLQYCAFSLGPGWPALGEFVYLFDYIQWVAANPLPDGRYHCIAAHASVYAPWNRGDMPWVNDEYIAGRWYKAGVIYKAKYGYDLADWPGVLAITEIGLSGGYSGDWLAPYTCQEVASAYWRTVEVYQEHGYPHALLWWNFGFIGHWVSDHDCADEIWG